jgi:hypothetical protein
MISSLAEPMEKFSDKRGMNRMMVDPSLLRREILVYGGGESSTQGKIHQQRRSLLLNGRLFYGGGY